jgi:hypothetical protein
MCDEPKFFYEVRYTACATVFIAPLRHILCTGADTPCFCFDVFLWSCRYSADVTPLR